MASVSAILVWKFIDAPDTYRNLSEFPSRASWLAVIPSGMQEEAVPIWMSGFSSFGTEEYWMRNGSRVIIG